VLSGKNDLGDLSRFMVAWDAGLVSDPLREEQVAVIDEDGRVVGTAPRSRMRRENLPHIVVAVLLRDSSGRVYVHRRTPTKDVFPGMYDCWAAGCLTAGEEPRTAAERELAEELGISGAVLTPLFTAWYADESTRHLCYAYTATSDGPIRHQAEEVAWGGWMTVDQLRQQLADPTWPFVPDGRAMLDRWLP
jgi:isopentenyldiphosphate isomerase